MSHYCAVSEARGRMPCGHQCDECYDHEHPGELDEETEARDRKLDDPRRGQAKHINAQR